IALNGSAQGANGGNNSLNINQSMNAPITFKVNGSERVRFDPLGYVGIGTTGPSSILHVKTTTNGDGIRLEGAAGSVATAYMLYNGASTRVGELAYAASGSNWNANALAGDTVLSAETGRLLLVNGNSSGLTVASGKVSIGNGINAQNLLDV